MLPKGAIGRDIKLHLKVACVRACVRACVPCFELRMRLVTSPLLTRPRRPRRACRCQVFKGGKHDHEAQRPEDITQHISIKPKAGPGAAALKAKKAA
jgi:hypothetical protein